MASLFFFQAYERPEPFKSCNLIGSESGRYFTILPANPSRIVGSFIHKFVFLKVFKKRFKGLFIVESALSSSC